ncbi:MAG: pheromone processing endoprotease [Sclerophora amabilis]|nr:MAG: pheromone processing endoprotease [Sclerophora amabilis]
MHALIGTLLLALAGCSAANGISARNYETNDYYALHLDPSISPLQLADSLGLIHEGQLGELKDHHIFSYSKHDGDMVEDAREELRRRRQKRDSAAEPDVLDGVKFAQKQKLKPRMQKRAVIPSPERQSPPPKHKGSPTPNGISVDSTVAKQAELAHSLDIQDPIFLQQWHLYNPIQVGQDINVTGVWRQGVTGKNTTVCIIDDGLDMYSDDLKDNYFAEGSYDFNDKGLEPRPRLSDDHHGTRCAGEIAAVKNDVCGIGVAWDAKVSGVRILSKQISDADEAVAMNYAFQSNQIYSCSWGPPDDGEAMDAPGILIKKAMVNAVQNGRGGKGSIFVFASGNGAGSDDNCNFDGYTNSIYSITIGAIDRKGLHPYYAEKCSAQLVVTYSSGSGDAIHTTDVGVNECYAKHGGTSAAAPIAAGIFALVLSVRPDLSWRDLQYLSLETAVPVNEDDGDWQNTTIGKRFSHSYGYGKIDAYAIVEAAKDFKSVKPQAWYKSAWMHVKHPIPQGDKGLASTVEVTKDQLGEANFERVEHVTLTMNVAHGRRGDLSVELKSPNGVVSHLSATRKFDKSTDGYDDWTFMSVVHWGETGVGNWTVVVKDTVENEFEGTFTDWKLTLWGECIDASKATQLPMPEENDDDDHDATTTVAATTTSISVGASPTAGVDTKPSDHIDRPVNEKPTNSGDSHTSTSASTPSPSAISAAASSSSTSSIPSASSTPQQDHFLPSFFPTFGVSKRTQIWIYGSVAIIIFFCIGLAAYFYTARRKRLLNISRGDYDFVDDGTNGGVGTGALGQKRSKRRAGELYDAFAGESDEELFSDDEDAQYRDEDQPDEKGEQDEDLAEDEINEKSDRERLLAK